VKIGLRGRVVASFSLLLLVLGAMGAESWRHNSQTVSYLEQINALSGSMRQLNDRLALTSDPSEAAQLIARREEGRRWLTLWNTNLMRDARTSRAYAGGTVVLMLVIGLVAGIQIVREIDAREAARRAVAHSSAMLRDAYDEVSDLYEHAPCGYHSIDASGIVVRMNETELRWLGYSREEVVGRMHVTDLVMATDIEATRLRLEEFARTDHIQDVRLEYRRKDGTSMPAIMSATALRDPTGRFVMTRTVVTEITELYRTQQELEALVIELQSTLESVRTLSGLLPICSMCHKIRDDTGYWERVETYISAHTHAEFSHGVCPTCFPRMFPGVEMETEDQITAD
jgi:PAS domain S-box-containing protein